MTGSFKICADFIFVPFFSEKGLSSFALLTSSHSHSEPFLRRETVSAAHILLILPSSSSRHHAHYSGSLIGIVRKNSHVGVWEFKVDIPHTGSVSVRLNPSHRLKQTA